MADNKDPDKSQNNNDSLDEEFDLDLDLFEDSSNEDDQEDIFTVDEADDDLLEPDLEDDLHDDLTDDLESDVIDLSDEEVQAEFAALEREVSRNEAEAGNKPKSGFNEQQVDDLEDQFAKGLNEDLDSENPATTLTANLEETDNPSAKSRVENDPDMSDDLDSALSREEFGVPDQDYQQDMNSEEDKEKSGKEGIMALGNNFPAILASLANLSPKVIVAATAVVLLPLVIFTVLGLNSRDSSSTNDARTASVNASTDSSDPALPEPPAPETESAPEPLADLSAWVVEEPVVEENVAEELLAEAEDTDPEQAATEETATAIDSAVDDLLATSETEQDPSPAGNEVTGNSVDTAALFAQTQSEYLPQASDTDASQEEFTGQEPEETPVPDATQFPEADIAITEEVEAEETNTEPPAEVDTEEQAGGPEAVAGGTDPIADTLSSGRDYHVIVASFPNETQARTHAERISDEEISAYVIPPFGAASNYRVAVASYASLIEAVANIPGLRAVYGEGIWPLRYPPAAEVPLLSGRTGGVFIIVASFPNEELARTHADTLVAASEQPAIIAPYAPSNRYRVAVARFDSIESAQGALPDYRQEYGQDLWLLSY